MQLFTGMCRSALFAALWLLSAWACAAPIKFYDMTLTVSSATVWSGYDCNREPQQLNTMFPFQPPQYAPHWGCINAGDVYTGRIGVDTSRLGSDGLFALSGRPASFELQFGRLVLGSVDLPDSIHFFAGFASGGCLGDPVFGIWNCTTYRMEHGELAGLSTTAYLVSDSASIFFSPDGRFSGGGHGTSFDGSMTLSAVSEPATLALVFLAGFGGVAATRRARKAR